MRIHAMVVAGASGDAKGVLEKIRREKKKKKTEARTITRTGIIPVTIPAPGLSKRGYRPL